MEIHCRRDQAVKRFYDAVDAQETLAGWQVTLDGRGLKTVKGAPQVVPTKTLATLLAKEWESQGDKIDPALFPMRDMTDYAIDVVGANLNEQAQKLLAFGDTDTLLYRADPDEPLHARQIEVWEPLVCALEDRENVHFTRISGIMHKPQNEATLSKLRAHLRSLSAFDLAAIENMTSLSASLVIALSAQDTAEEDEAKAYWHAASLEEEWQADLWGRDEEAEERRAKREGDFLNAWRYLRALKD